jgi:hypothetical protein
LFFSQQVATKLKLKVHLIMIADKNIAFCILMLDGMTGEWKTFGTVMESPNKGIFNTRPLIEKIGFPGADFDFSTCTSLSHALLKTCQRNHPDLCNIVFKIMNLVTRFGS